MSYPPQEFTREPTPESAAPTGALGVMTFVLCIAMFIGGCYLMGIGFEDASPLLFVTGLLASGVAFLIPLQLLPNLD